MELTKSETTISQKVNIPSKTKRTGESNRTKPLKPKSTLHKVRQSKKESKERMRISHDLIKKGFNVCYALDDFIKASLAQNVIKM